MTRTHPDNRKLLMALYEEAVRAALPAAILPAHLPPLPKGRFVVFAIGKAAASMAAATEAHYADTKLEGIALTRYGHGVKTCNIEVIEAGHPVPDANGVTASARIMEMAEGLEPDDFALILISGGGSALATLPIDGVALEDKQALTKALLNSGAPIHDINTVRKHLSRIKGGRLAAAIAPARSLTLTISDVAGNDPAVIASGPTVPDPSTKEDALAILDRWKIDVPATILAALKAAPESPKAGDKVFVDAHYELVASGMGSLNAATRLAETEGYEVINLGDALEGEARNLAKAHADLALAAKAEGRKCAIISGGEVSVTFERKTDGRGGPSQEYALALALALEGAEGISALAGDTDGIDGGNGAHDDPAGAMIFPDTPRRAKEQGLDAQKALEDHNSGGFFDMIGDLVKTGPSFTNVNDFRVILIERSSATKAG